MTRIAVHPAQTTLAEWRDLYRGATATLDPACWAVVETSAAAVARIVVKANRSTGVNTGFGKLASVRIAEAESRRPAAQYRALARRGRRRSNA